MSKNNNSNNNNILLSLFNFSGLCKRKLIAALIYKPFKVELICFPLFFLCQFFFFFFWVFHKAIEYLNFFFIYSEENASKFSSTSEIVRWWILKLLAFLCLFTVCFHRNAQFSSSKKRKKKRNTTDYYWQIHMFRGMKEINER